MAGFHCMSVSISTENFLQNAILNYLDSFKLACLKMESNFFMVSLHMTPKKKKQQSGTLFTQHYWQLFTFDIHNNCYGLPVHLPYIVITCACIDSIKRVCSEPPYCLGEFSDLLSADDNNTDTNSDLYFFFIEKIIIINYYYY